MDFDVPEEVRTLQSRVRQFIADEVIPLERHESDTEGLPTELVAVLHQKAKRAGLWAPQLPREYGGLGLETMALCLLFEEAGRSPIGPLALHCAAPDEGNMHLLLRAATPEQRRQYLEPLARGEIRSCFAMTEPAPGAGSDPTLMLTRAERRGERWVLNGHKWFATGARGAAFAIVAAVTEPNVPAKHGVTLFIVETNTPGYEFIRSVPTMTGEGQGGHCELKLSNCAVHETQVLGGVGNGF
ncbi:MAG TPA: acyl-CoA dehydrogenase family protein, partial [Gemmataceae bacterium]|nr:acyl-CoA dehydrogenase family protein [Gemmataceae bacterium]